MGDFCQLQAVLRLGERFAARQGEPVGERVFEQLLRHLLHGHLPASAGIMALRVVAAGTVVGAPLDKAGEPEAGAVYDGVLYQAKNFH